MYPFADYLVTVNIPPSRHAAKGPDVSLEPRMMNLPKAIDTAVPYHWMLRNGSLLRIPKPSLEFSNFTESRANYAALLELLDSELGQLLNFLESVRDLRDTIIFLTSDHGEHLGDHGEWSKFSPWEVSNHVPLIASGPGILSGRVETTPVSIIDLAATFLDLAGLQPAPWMDSRSLMPVLSGSGGTTIKQSCAKRLARACWWGVSARTSSQFSVQGEVVSARSVVELGKARAVARTSVEMLKEIVEKASLAFKVHRGLACFQRMIFWTGGSYSRTSFLQVPAKNV